MPDGAPAPNVFVQAQGQLKTGGDRGNVWLSATTDGNGEFRFSQVPEGTFTLQVRGGSDEQRWRGSLDGIEVNSGVPIEGLRLEVKNAMVVKGRVDMAAFGQQKLRWAWIGFHRLQPDDPPTADGMYTDGVGVDTDTGSFVADELSAGRYRVALNVYSESDRKNQGYPCGTIDVPATGLQNVVLVPQLN
jgi:hypothetical protein